MNKRRFCNLLDRIELELHQATESHGGLLPIQQLVVALRFYVSASFFCKWRHGLPCVFTVININEAVSNVNSMVSMVNDTPNVNTSDMDAIDQ